MRCLDLFAGGCNGFGLAAKWMGWKTVACVEIDPFSQKLLKKNFPESEVYGDIREFNRDQAANYRGSIDLITGGFPCQPFSHAGKRAGTNDDRYLWPAMLETIRIVQPSFIIGENVAGLTSMDDGQTFDNILASLEDEGYTVESFILPACGIGAWHRRDRVWIIAYCDNRLHNPENWKVQTRRNASDNGDRINADTNGLDGDIPGFCTSRIPQQQKTGILEDNANATSPGLSKSRQARKQKLRKENKSRVDYRPAKSIWWTTEPGLDRMVHGLPNRTHRIKALGNSVVPQVVYEIYQAIEKTFLT